jgi:hypothetical protein
VNVNSVTAGGPSCSATSGGLTLRAKVVRGAGISPLLVFFDATGTSDSARLAGANNTFQDVSYSWSFGDTGASGSGTWAYGSNAGHNSKNTATGAVAAHLYVTNGSDTTYPVTVTAYDGTNTASCSLGVTAYDPSGANGFPGSATTCVAASSMPVAGSGGCPTGAAVLRQSNIGTAFTSALASGKRVLFKCGDTFTGSANIGSFTTAVSKASIGAYGGCENTTTNRPIFSSTGGATCITWSCVIALYDAVTPSDIRITDLDFESSGQTGMAIGSMGVDTSVNPVKDGETQITLYNLNAKGYAAGFWMTDATQSGLINSTVIGKALEGYASYWNWTGNHCRNASSAFNCGGTPVYVPVDYNAIIGNNMDGAPNSGPGNPPAEILRLPACRFCVVSNNRLANSSQNWGATLKFLNASGGGGGPWLGQYTEYTVISDNLLTGTSGSIKGSIAPTNNTFDERIRYIILERNLIQSGGGAAKFLVSGTNITVRNNVVSQDSTCGNTSGANCSDYGFQVSQNGIEPVPQFVEVYNNTCYNHVTEPGCVGFIGGDGTHAPGINSWAQNNLFYNNGSAGNAVTNNGAGNTVSNNTTNSAANPLLINASGFLSRISDFQPTQNYFGGGEVPVWYDALGEAWSPTWYLGALKP